jgi:hypothetical protein
MTRALSGRPEPGEYPSYSQAYIDCVEGGDILAALSAQLESTLKLLARVDDHFAGTFVYAPGKWTIKQVLGHIIDSERIFAYRALRIARNDSTPLPGFDQDAYIPFSASNERSLSSLLDEFSVVRQATIALLRSIPSDAWLRKGLANDYGVTVRGAAFQAGGHEAHHVGILRERYLPQVKA